MPRANKKRDEDKEDSDDDDEERDTTDQDEEELAPFSLGRSIKLASFTFITFILLMSDVFILRVMDRAGADLVSGRTPTKKGVGFQGLVLVFAMVVLDFLIVKEKL